MLVTIGLMVASYCLARLALVTLTQPPGQSKSAAFAVCVIAGLGCLGVAYFAAALIGQATERDDRVRVEVR